MADLVLPPSVKVADLVFEDWAPAQSSVVAPVLAEEVVSGSAGFSFRGRVVLAPKASNGRFDRADKEFASFVRRLRGRRNRVKLPLPKMYLPSSPPPADAAATVGTGTRVIGESLLLALNVSNFGAWTLLPDDWINVGDRLYGVDVVSGNNVTCTPGVLPVAASRPRGFQSVGPSPVTTLTPYGLGVFEDSLFMSFYDSVRNVTDCYHVDPWTGDYTLVWEAEPGSTGLGTHNNRLWGFGRSGPVQSAAVYVAEARLPRIADNGLELVLTLTGTGAGRIEGMAEWIDPTDSTPAPKLYVATATKLWVAKLPMPASPVSGNQAWGDYFEEVADAGAFTSLAGLSPGPDGKLWLLDTGPNRGTLYTWDGAEKVAVGSDRFGGPVGPRARQSQCLEWFNGDLLFGFVGNQNRGLWRLNLDTPTTAPKVELAAPFVMARLAPSGIGPGPLGVAPVTFDFTEALR